MTYDPANLARFFQHYADTETSEKSAGAKIERYMDDIDDLLNDILESWALKEVADIAALRGLYEFSTWDNSATQHIARDNQIRKVIAASDGTNTYMALYWFDDGASESDADGSSGNVDTDGIVEPTSGRATGRWKRIALVGNDGTAAFVHRDGIEALRTMLKYLYINLTAGASDVALQLKKRTAGSQIKILTNEQVAIRNLADSAYEDFAALAGTFAGAVSGTTGTFSGAVSGTTGTFSGAVSGTTGTFSGAVSIGGNLDCNSNKLTEVANATVSTDAPNLGQVQSLISSSNPKVYVSTASAGPLSTLTETSVIGSGTGSLTIAGGSLVAGSVVRIRAIGTTDANTASSHTLTFKFKLGSTTYTTVTTGTGVAVNGDGTWVVEGNITIVTAGAGGTANGQMVVRFSDDSADTVGLHADTSISTDAIDTTGNLTIDLTATASHNTFSIPSTNVLVEVLL